MSCLLTVVGATITAYVMRDAIVETIQDKALESYRWVWRFFTEATGSVIPVPSKSELSDISEILINTVRFDEVKVIYFQTIP